VFGDVTSCTLFNVYESFTEERCL